uniref:GTP cyclohydrolase I n=1 Tax=Siphoviridae sp. ctaDn21 TaxID=2825563 RepID=A0A8S5UUU3_9CAUD|nr:MAG TPA: GTP cyclohydrolase I [Siphoviridae sp. ctaDn21]
MEIPKLDKMGNVLGREHGFASLKPTEIVALDNAEAALQGLFELLGEDAERDGLQDTPFRFVKALAEHTVGYRENPKLHLEKTFDVDHQDLVLVKDIPFNSLCEHHLAPFVGKVHIAYIPSDKITGLSKFGRVVEGYAKRLQVQERLTQEIADAIQEVLNPQAVAVIIEAEHTCMSGRGIKKHGASTVTSTMRGLFKENASARAELLQLIKK